ncbi:lipase family alpha/beta hydrolase [Orientia tsutsugamushi]|uniref:lipase family alpha/beta hydrolase n=1 Tax=Orientia tsutsugamushi TaxID=784 RepID=UPI003528C395
MIIRIILLLVSILIIKVQAFPVYNTSNISAFNELITSGENTIQLLLTTITATSNTKFHKLKEIYSKQNLNRSFVNKLNKNYPEDQGTQLLVLLHGLSKTSNSLRGMEKFAYKQGFKVLNIDYPSTKFPIEHLVDIIHNKITLSLQQQKYTSISFVGVSMGGLVIRAYLHKYKIPNLGKVVLIGTPNKGSEVADYLKNNKLYKKFTGPAGQQLITNQKEFNNIFGDIYYECGVISGNLPLDPCCIFMKGKLSDGKVTIESTKIEGMQDHIVLKIPHWYLEKSKKVWLHTLYFLKYSKF